VVFPGGGVFTDLEHLLCPLACCIVCELYGVTVWLCYLCHLAFIVVCEVCPTGGQERGGGGIGVVTAVGIAGEKGGIIVSGVDENHRGVGEGLVLYKIDLVRPKARHPSCLVVHIIDYVGSVVALGQLVRGIVGIGSCDQPNGF